MFSRWALWSQPRHLVAYVLTVEFAALTLAVACWWSDPIRPSQSAGFALIAVCAAVGVEISRRVEQLRERHMTTTYKTLHAVWLVPTLLLFPPGAVCLLAVLVHAWVWFRVGRRFTLYRWVMCAAGNVLGGGLGALTFALIAGPGTHEGHLPSTPMAVFGALAGATVLVVVDLFLVGTAMVMANPTEGIRACGTVTDQLIEVAAVCFGLLAAAAYTVSPPLVALALPPLAFLQRTLLFSQYQEAARTDAKTGLVNAAWWHELANREVERALRLGEEVSVLVADLDHFKQVNDTYGHLAGDIVLRAVASELKASVREYDEVGRFGGEEFVVVLPSTGLDRAWEVAERLRACVTELQVHATSREGRRHRIDGLSVSIGLATLPEQANDLSGLLQLADAALYAAKTAGRNRVCSAPDMGEPEPVSQLD
jgi:diguanylate cyclase (GGDEF)-like protein